MPTILAIVGIVFLLPRLMPGDPLLARVDPSSSIYVVDQATRARFLSYYGLDRPLPAQFLHYLDSLAHGDLGWSISHNVPVSTLIAEHLPWTLLLLSTSIGIASLLAFLGGVAAAWRRGRRSDRVLVVATTAVRTLPEYAWAAVLLILFAVVFPVLPLAGARTPFAHDGSLPAEIGDVAKHLVLPAASLSLGMLAGAFLLVRNSTIGALGQDYMLLARAKGLPERRLRYRHAGRNALLPFLTLIGIQVGFAVGGAVFVESTFSYPGMGSLILQAVSERDYPVLEATFLVLSATVLVANAAVDLLYAFLDPRAARR